MDKTKLKGVAALIAAAVAVILAAFLCMSFPMAEVQAAEAAGVQEAAVYAAAADTGTTEKTEASVASVTSGGETKYYTVLRQAFMDAKDGDTVDILKSVTDTDEGQKVYHSTFNGGIWLYIQGKSITINGHNNTLTATSVQWAFYVINAESTGAVRKETLKLKINDLTIIAKDKAGYPLGLFNEYYDLSLNNVTLDSSGTTLAYSTANLNNTAALLFGGAGDPSLSGDTKTIEATITDSTLKAHANRGYAVWTCNPVKLTVTGGEMSGWSALRMSSTSDAAGGKSRGSAYSDIALSGVTITSDSTHNTSSSNMWGIFVFQDSNVKLNVNDCDIDVTANSDPADSAPQYLVYYSSKGANPVISGNEVNFTGSVVSVSGNAMTFTGGYGTPVAGRDIDVEGGSFNFAIEGAYLAEGCVLTQDENGNYVSVQKATAEADNVAYVTSADGSSTIYYADLQAAIDAAKAGDAVTLLTDVAVTEAITVDKAVTISGKGADGNYTVSTSAAAQVFNVTAAEGTVTFENITVKNTNAAMNASAVALSGGKAHAVFTNAVLDTSGAGKNSHPLFIGASSDGSDTTYNVTATGSAFKADAQGYAIQLIRKAELNISGSTLEGWAAVYTETESVNARIRIGQSTITGRAPALSGASNRFGVFALYGNYTKLTVEESKIDVSRDEVTEGYEPIYALLIFNTNKSQNCKTTLTDNTITIGDDCDFSTGDGSMNNATASVSGGSINVPLNSKYIGSGSLAMNEDGTYTVSEEPAVAQVTHNSINYYKFASLAQAFAAAESFDTITLLADTELDEQIRLQLEGYNTATLTFDLNGKTLTVGTGLGNTSAIWVGNGYTFTLEDSVGGGVIDGTHMDEESVVLSAMQATAKVIIEGGTIKVDTAKESCVFVKDGTLTIDGGAFINECKEEYAYKAGSPALAVNVNDSNTSGQHLIINGGTFVGRNPLLGDTNSNVTGSYMGSNVQVGLNAEGEFVAFTGSVPEGVASVYGLDESGALTVTVYTAEALAAALKEAAFADDTAATVILGKDITADVTVAEGREVTLDLGGHNLTNSGTAAGDHTIVNYGNLTVTGNGTVDNTVHQGGALVNYGVAILSGGTFTRSQEAGANGSANGNSWYTLKNYGHLTIKEGTTVTTRLEDETGKRVGTCSSLIANGYQNEKDHTNNSGKVTANVGNNATIVIEGGTFSGGINTVKNDEGGVATISGGTFTNVTQATVMNWNKLTISGGTFNVKDDAVIAVVSGCYTSDIGSSGETTITDGTFYGSITVDGAYGADVTYAISGGDFSVMPDYTYFEEGYAAAWDEDTGMYVTDSGDYVAAIENFGYTSLQAAIDAADSGATVTLLKDLIESVTVAEGQEIVLDLNGCTLTNSGTNTIVNNGTLTVTGNGKVDNTVHQGAALQNNGKATLENGTFTRSKEAGKDDNANGNSWYVIDNSGTLTLKKVTVYQGTDEVNALQWTFSSTIRNKGASAEQMAVMEVDGATVVSGRIALKNDDWGKMTIADANVTGGNQAVQNWAQLEINGGTFAGDVVTWFYAIPGSEPETRTHATITGGTFNGRVTCVDYDQDEGKVEIDQGVTISGTASFSEMPKYTYFADDYIAAWDEDSEMYVTAQGDWAAVINDETAYATLGEALAAAKDGDTVMLLNDIELASGSAVKDPSLGIALTIDLNGHTITSADGYSAVFDITTTKSFTLTSSKEGAAIEAAYALRLRGSGTGEVAIAVENIAFSGAYVFNSPLTFGRLNTTQVSVTLRNVHAAYTDNLKNMQSFLLNADRLASLQVTGSTITVSSTNAEKAQGAYAVNLIATEAAFTDSTIAATGTLARGIYSHNFGTVISALTLNNTAVTAEDIAIESSYADLTVNGGTVTSNASAAVLFFGHMTPESAAAAIDTQEGYQTLTVTGGAQISGYTFGIGGNAAGTYDGTVMNIEDAVITGGEEAPGVFQPHVGILNIGGENTKITGSSGVVVRAGRLNITGGTFIATYATLNTVEGSGSVIDGAAVAVSHHSSNQPLTVSITGGTFNGVYSVYEDTLLSGPDPAKVSVSLAGGVYNGGVYSENKAGFITGGSFKQQPAEELFDENYAAEYQNGYYVAVRSDALKTARANAQADVRGYAAANGISWLALAEEAAPAEGEEPVYTAQQAADILAAFNAIDSAMTQLAVAEARLAAMNMVDAYVEALDTYKLDMIGDLQTAAADDEETADVDESVVLPTATYSAIYNATSASEIDFYVANALAEIEAIRSLRTEISGQTQQLADLADALTAMSEGLFGDTESGTQGAFAELFDKVEDAISKAQDAIVNGEEGSTSLSSLQEYLEKTINVALTEIKDALTDTETGLEAIKEAIDNLDVSDQLADEIKTVTDAITAAQKAINGHTDTQLSDAITEINDATEDYINGLREALIGENGTGGVLGTIVDNVSSLEKLLGDKDSGLAAIVEDIEEAKAAIMGVTEEDADGVNLSEVLEAVNTADSVIDQVLAAVQGLTDEGGILTQIKSAVDELTELNIGGKFNDVLDAITDAQEAIMGTTEESAGTSIAGAVTAITGVVNALTKEDGMVYAINETLNALREALTGTESNAFTKLAEQLKLAIIGTGDATLTSIASGVAGANEAIANVLAAVQALTDADDGIVAQVETELAEMLKKIETLTGALATSEQVKGIETGIADAKTEIDKIVAAIGSLGTGEGNDLATQIGGIVSDIEAVQGAIGEIGTNLGVAVDIEETKTNAVADLEVWLNAYLDTLLGTTTDEAESGVVMLAVTLETEDGDLYGRLTQAYSEANAQLILKYYNQALTAIDNATSTTDVSTAVSTFRAQVASVDAAAQNTPSMTGVYVLLAIVLVVLIAASIVVILKNRKAAAAVAAQPAAEAAAEEKPAEEAKPEAAEEAAEEGSETEESAEAEKPEAEEELAADDDDKEQVVIAANVRSFAEAYVELSDEQRELFNKVKEYALGKEGTSEAKLSSGVCVKLGSKQVVKLAVRRGNPVALFVLENEMLKDFRRGAATQAKLKVRATELVLREEADLETAYTMVDLSVDQIKKDAEAAKERRREQRRERRKQRLAEEAARQAEHDGSED